MPGHLSELDDSLPIRLETKLSDHSKLDFRAQWEHHLLVPGQAQITFAENSLNFWLSRTDS